MGRRRYTRDLIHRWEGNPIIRAEDVPFPCLDVRNAGVVKFEGRYILLLTIEALDGRTRIYRAESEDGYYFDIHPSPVLACAATDPFATYECSGVKDARVTLLDGTYYVVYTANSPVGLRLVVARTRDFKTFERLSLASEPDTKGGALFPERVKDRYARLERPREGYSIWVSYSDDLLYWGGSEFIMGPRHGFWDFHRIGSAVPPIPVEEGWLVIYYGEKLTSAGPLFRLGAAVLDRADPTRILGRSDVPILSPRERYERVGDVGNLVYSCGAVLEDGEKLRLYYGGSDSCICIGTAPVARIVERCLHGREEMG